MAVTNNPTGKLDEATAASDEVAEGRYVEAVAITNGAITTAGSVILVDPVDTSQELWRTERTATDDNTTFLQRFHKRRYWPNGWRVGTLTPENSTISVYYV